MTVQWRRKSIATHHDDENRNLQFNHRHRLPKIIQNPTKVVRKKYQALQHILPLRYKESLKWKYFRGDDGRVKPFLIILLITCIFINRSFTSSLNRNRSDYMQNIYHPRHLGCYFEKDKNDDGRTVITNVERLKIYWNRYPSKRQMDESEEHIRYVKKKLYNSKIYRHSLRDEPWQADTCEYQHEWQQSSHPTCNTIHEVDFTNTGVKVQMLTTEDTSKYHKLVKEERVRLMTNGYWRDIWRIRMLTSLQQNETTPVDDDDFFVTKTLRMIHDFDDRNYDRHRRDAVAMERLSSSPYVVDIYAYCSNSVISPYASRGDINDFIWPITDEGKNNLTSIDKLSIAIQVASGINDMHTVDNEDKPSMAHTDITTGQFIFVNGLFRLNDFNRVRFLTKNKDTGNVCPYRVGRNPGKFRSPEEYLKVDQTEKVDIYAMGNIFYVLLSEQWPFENDSEKYAQTNIAKRKRAKLSQSLVESKDPCVRTLIEAMNMCWRHDQFQRPSAFEILTFLETRIKQIKNGNRNFSDNME